MDTTLGRLVSPEAQKGRPVGFRDLEALVYPFPVRAKCTEVTEWTQGKRRLFGCAWNRQPVPRQVPGDTQQFHLGKERSEPDVIRRRGGKRHQFGQFSFPRHGPGDAGLFNANNGANMLNRVRQVHGLMNRAWVAPQADAGRPARLFVAVELAGDEQQLGQIGIFREVGPLGIVARNHGFQVVVVGEQLARRSPGFARSQGRR